MKIITENVLCCCDTVLADIDILILIIHRCAQMVLLIGNVHTECNYSTCTIQQQALLVAVAAASYVEYSTDNPFIFFMLAVLLIRRPMMPLYKFALKEI